MRLINKTHLDGRLLKSFVRRVMEHEQFTPQEISQFKVVFRYRKRSHARQDDHPGGYAYYHSKAFTITPVKGVMPDKPALAKVIAHELAHCQGVKHRNMHVKAYGWVDGWREHWLWTESLPLAMSTITVVPKPTAEDKLIAKLEHCEAMLAKWQRQVRLAKTKEAHWRDKVRHYERRQAALPVSPTTSQPVTSEGVPME